MTPFLPSLICRVWVRISDCKTLAKTFDLEKTVQVEIDQINFVYGLF